MVQDDAAAEKSDPDDDLSDDSQPVVARCGADQGTKAGKFHAAESDEDAGADTWLFAPPLSVCTDQCATE